jgi:hypothetical protein
MKFLLVVSILATSAAFANVNDHKIKCYYPAQQGGDAKIAYVLEEQGNSGFLRIAYPDIKGGPLKPDNGCLKQPGGPEILLDRRLELCEGEGQEINRLVPIEASYGRDEETVYCERDILDYFDRRGDNDDRDEDDK